MSQRDPFVRMRHMLDHANEAVDLLGNVTEQELRKDRTIQLALTRLVEILGEAASKVPQGTRDQYLQLPWHQAISMRNILIHGYDVLEYAIIWDTVRNNLPPLIDELSRILNKIDRPRSIP